jgi:aminopeptidase N
MRPLFGWPPAAALIAALLVIPAAAPAQDAAGDKTLTLKIGDPRFKDKTLDVASNELTSMESGKPVPFAKMIQEMKPARIIYVGETHNSLPIHDLQARIVEALYEQDRHLCIGLEMFPVTVQDVLTKWSLGVLSEEEFIREAQWYVNWNFNFAYYRRVFLFAKENRIPIVALNAPREIITKIRMSGWDTLRDDEKAIVPKLDLAHPEHRQLIRAIFEGMEIPHQMRGAGLDMMFEGLYRAQSAWDHVMGTNAAKGVAREQKKMVVLVGSGHVIYNLGANLRGFQASKFPFKTVVGVFVPKEKPSFQVARSLADYMMGVPEEARPAYPSVGLSFKKFKGIENLVIDAKPQDGAALGQDFEKGDVILDVDGKPYGETNELRTILAKIAWDGEVKFRLLRAGVEKAVTLKFKEGPPPAPEMKK